MSDWVIEAAKLTRRFGDLTAVDQLDLQVERGNIYGFLGPNGSGKTTAIRMLTGLLLPSAGEVSVLGQQLPQGAEKLRLKIGYMTQKFSLYEDLSVDENLEFIARIYGLNRKDRQQRVAEQLHTYSLDDQREQLAGGMSGGQRQRLALAAATLHPRSCCFSMSRPRR